MSAYFCTERCEIPWHRYRSFIDIGCAEGALPVQVARAHHTSPVAVSICPGRRDALPTGGALIV